MTINLYMSSSDKIFIQNIFHLSLMESTDVEPMYTGDQLYSVWDWKNPRKFVVSRKLSYSAFQETPAGRLKSSCLTLPLVQMLMPGRSGAYCWCFVHPLVLWSTLFSVFVVNAPHGFWFDLSHEKDWGD
jgi:hypothetical protein